MCVYVGNHCIHDVILWLIWGFKVFLRLTQCDACEQQMWTRDGRVNRNTHCRTLNSTGHADTHTLTGRQRLVHTLVSVDVVTHRRK